MAIFEYEIKRNHGTSMKYILNTDAFPVPELTDEKYLETVQSVAQETEKTDFFEACKKISAPKGYEFKRLTVSPVCFNMIYLEKTKKITAKEKKKSDRAITEMDYQYEEMHLDIGRYTDNG